MCLSFLLTSKIAFSFILSVRLPLERRWYAFGDIRIHKCLCLPLASRSTSFFPYKESLNCYLVDTFNMSNVSLLFSSTSADFINWFMQWSYLRAICSAQIDWRPMSINAEIIQNTIECHFHAVTLLILWWKTQITFIKVKMDL